MGSSEQESREHKENIDRACGCLPRRFVMTKVRKILCIVCCIDLMSSQVQCSPSAAPAYLAHVSIHLLSFLHTVLPHIDDSCIHSTDAHVHDFFRAYMASEVTDDEFDLVLHYYPSNSPARCSFNTGFRNNLRPQFKRIAAIQENSAFRGPRRVVLKTPVKKKKSGPFHNLLTLLFFHDAD